jgi:hypothetical protein
MHARVLLLSRFTMHMCTVVVISGGTIEKTSLSTENLLVSKDLHHMWFKIYT